MREIFAHNQSGKLGFTLIEVVVATGVFLLFALGVHSVTQVTLQTVANSRTTIIETAVLNEQVEIVRNLSYGSVGVVGGVPVGVLPANQIISRNGVAFMVAATVRNVDDPSDGTLDDMEDTAPADYKLVEFTVSCQSCRRLTAPLTLSTIVAPKKLEGASDNGALFIKVFDAAGLPVAGAKVRISNTKLYSPIMIDDVTGIDGAFRLIDTPTSSLGYDIMISKSGYSSDYTVTNTIDDASATKLPATVASQTVTPISFSIDRLAALSLKTLDANCKVLGAKKVELFGDKLIATDPDMAKLYQVITTDAGGAWTWPSIEWDTYTLSASGTSYDIAGAKPPIPFIIKPGEAALASLILVPHTAYSLLVKVRDAGTGAPLANATVELLNSKGKEEKTIVTGPGYMTEADCTAPGQAWFSGLKADTYILKVSRAGYDTNEIEVDVDGRTDAEVGLAIAN